MTENTGHREQIQMYLHSEVDMNKLDNVLALHPFLYQLATENMPELQTWMDTAKFHFESVKAQVSSQYRTGVEQETGKKPTERQIEEYMLTSPEVAQAHAEYLEATEAFRKCRQLEDSFRQRESSIKNLCSLYASQYWSLNSLEDKEPEQAAVVQKKKFKTRQ